MMLQLYYIRGLIATFLATASNLPLFYDGPQAFFEFGARDKYNPPAGGTPEADINPGAHDQPFLSPAGMGFLKPHHIPDSVFLHRNTPL
jgi:hypothetical protein